MLRRRTSLAVAAISAPAIVATLAFAGPAASASTTGQSWHHHEVVYVSVHGKDTKFCGSFKKPCGTISQGVLRADAGDTVKVEPGTYAEMVTVTKALTLIGFQATINANGHDNGVLLEKNASWSTVAGFAVKNAIGEGILAVGLSHVTIAGNVVTHNDLGATMPNGGGYMQCQAQGQVPGDCGEGVHLMSDTWSKAIGNQVVRNVGGILLTDEFGPNAHNAVIGNNASFNSLDCGITLPSHNPEATTNPAKGGVYDNLVAFNVANSNGLVSGAGAGILVAAAGPGMASYDNTIKGNIVKGNALSGVTIHSHTPDQNVSGNRIIGNWIGTNNVSGDPDAGDTATTGILVFSAVVPVNGTVIDDNHISHNHFGIWLSSNVSRQGIRDNDFDGVAVRVFVHP
jgi:nitrous oxidase accessory protein NosD